MDAKRPAMVYPVHIFLMETLGQVIFGEMNLYKSSLASVLVAEGT